MTLAGTICSAYREPGSAGVVTAPIPDGLNALPLERAYRLQHEVVDRLARRWGVGRAGFKISCTGAADRDLIGASEPVYGVLTDAHLLATGECIDLADANDPLVEPELLLRLTRVPNPDDELADCIEVAAGLEVPTSRFREWWPPGELPNLTLGGLVADNAVAGVVVAGAEWTRLSATDIDALTVEVRHPDGAVSRGRATNAYGSPLAALAWLIAATRRHGMDLPVGTVVASGTFAPPIRAQRGTYVAHYPHIGAVEVSFDDSRLDAEETHHGA